MTLRLNGNLQIENLSHCSEAWVQALRESLARGARVVPDPKRQTLYELQTGDKRFYFDLLPSRHKIILLAAWPTEPTRLEPHSQ